MPVSGPEIPVKRGPGGAPAAGSDLFVVEIVVADGQSRDKPYSSSTVRILRVCVFGRPASLCRLSHPPLPTNPGQDRVFVRSYGGITELKGRRLVEFVRQRERDGTAVASPMTAQGPAGTVAPPPPPPSSPLPSLSTSPTSPPPTGLTASGLAILQDCGVSPEEAAEWYSIADLLALGLGRNDAVAVEKLRGPNRHPPLRNVRS